MTFNQALVPGLLNAGNWTMKAQNQNWVVGGSPVAVGSVVNMSMVPIGGPALGSLCSYAAAPPDVVGLVGGVPAAAFVNFPVTVV